MAVNIGLPSDGLADQGWKLYVTSLIMVLAAGLFVIARCATRLACRQFGSDDYVIVAALAWSIGLSVAIQLAVVHGYGEHQSDLSKEQLTLALKWFFIAQVPYKIVVCLNKVSAILLYRRIFVTDHFRIACWCAMAVVVVWSFGAIFATIFQCVPVAGSWDASVMKNAKCINKGAFWIAYAVANIATDVMVLSLPIPMVLRLNLKLRERLMLCCIFLLGGFVVICSVLRTTAVSDSILNESDITYSFIPRGIWTLVEANTGTICACLPILRGALRRAFPRLFATTRRPSAAYTTSFLNTNDNGRGRAGATCHRSGTTGNDDKALNNLGPTRIETWNSWRASDEENMITEMARGDDGGIGPESVQPLPLDEYTYHAPTSVQDDPAPRISGGRRS